ncbi:BON domain-containing protein [Thiomonas sp. FB-Cd]|uniref:BON domain-containing protein n=1 Tax=Thiomonas sp. FB-Cd TaxID=1158292 RepID=UPI0009DCE020|nr:BON domain-containing protein [Thiomonas sp. FB-Cd]
MTTNSRLGRVIPATGATVFLLALGSVRSQAVEVTQDKAVQRTSLAQFAHPRDESAGPWWPQRGFQTHVDDASIAASVKEALLRDETLSRLDIRVEARKGVARLSGAAASAKEAARAVHVARATQGVRLVMSDLHVYG